MVLLTQLPQGLRLTTGLGQAPAFGSARSRLTPVPTREGGIPRRDTPSRHGDRPLCPLGLALLCGSASEIGAVSYSLGGGLGPLGRAHGWAADHVRRLRLVTADGTVRAVDAASEPDLSGP